MKPKQKPTKFLHQVTEDSSVSLGVFDDADLRLTPQNRLLVLYKDAIYWPFLDKKTNLVRFDWSSMDTVFNPLPKTAFKKVYSVLLKQKEIREQNALDFDEDDAAYTFWTIQ